MAVFSDRFLQELRKAVQRVTRIRAVPAIVVGEGTRPGMTIVKYSNGQTQEVLNYRIASAADLRVRVGVDPLVPGVPQILGLRFNPRQFAPGQLWNMWVASHHKNHEFPGPDTVYVQGAQFVPLNLVPSGGMKVKVYGSVLRMGATWARMVYEEVDLTSRIPSNAARYVLVEVDSTPAVVLTNGATKDDRAMLAVTDIPAPTNGRVAIAAVIVFDGQTEIVRDVRPGRRNDVEDLRWAAFAPGGSGGAAVWGAITGTLSDQTDLKSALDGKAALSHTHAAGDITSGELDGDRLPAMSASKKGGVPATGAPSGKFLKDDATWATPGGGSLDDLTDVVITSPASGEALVYDGSNWVNDDIPAPTGTADRLAIFNNTGDLAAGAELIWDTTYKVLSIGLVDPIVHDAGSYASLRQTSEGGGASNFLTTYSDTTASFITGIRTRGTSISPSAVKKDDALLRIRGWGHDGTALSSSRTAIYMAADEDWDTSHHGTRLEFHTTPKAATTMELAASLDGDGNLDIKSGGKYKVGGSNLIATATDLGGASPSDLIAPSQKAAKTYIDAKSAEWDERSETWTRTDNHTFTLTGDQTATYRKGRKVRYKDGGSYEYGVIKSATYDGGTDKTTVTLIANNDYAMAAGAISDTALSDMTNPPGFPDYFNYTPVLSCSGSMTISSSTIGLACWRADGSMMTVWHNINLQLGGTAHTTIFVKLPANPLINALAAAVNCRDTGSGQPPVGAGQIASTIFAYRLADVSNWTVGGSSNAAILGSGSYPF